MDRERHQTREQDRNPRPGDSERHETEGKDQLQSDWKELRTPVQLRWTKLTGPDLDRVSGNYEQLLAMIQERYGITRQQAKRELDEFMSTHDSGELASVRTGAVREAQPRQPDTKEGYDETIERE